MAAEYCSTKYLLSAAEVSEAMYGNQLIFMQSFLTFFPVSIIKADLSLLDIIKVIQSFRLHV